MAIMTSVHRVVVSQDTYKALQAEAMVRQSSIQAVMDSIIIDHISQPAREILKALGSKEPADKKAVAADKPASQKSTRAGRPKQLAKSVSEISRIKYLWGTTDLPVADIARDIDRPRQTVEALIKRLIERGELARRAESGQISGETI
jgi:DNA-binding MarR family transcriptional regulator